MTGPIDEVLEISVAIDIAVNVLHSGVIEDINLGGALHYLDGMSFWQTKLGGRVPFEPQIFDCLDEQVCFQVPCAHRVAGCDGQGLF
jgi:hypothetical protein